MQCPACGTPNPTQARFCLGCGYLLVTGVVCAACHTLLPPHARYCYHCGAFLAQPAAAGEAWGTQLAVPQPVPQTVAPVVPQPAIAPQVPQVAVSPTTPPVATEVPATPAAPAAPDVSLNRLPAPRPLPEMLFSLSHYLPLALYEPLERRPNQRHLDAVQTHLSALLRTAKTYLPWPVIVAPQPPGEPAGGMYRGTFLFGDVSGFTPLSEKLKGLGQLGAERITGIINSLFTELVRVLFDHGGVLLKFGGDALLGLFPAETDEELAAGALRAAQAAVAMQEVMKQDQFAAIEAGGEVQALRIKCGISSGSYFAAHIGVKPNDANYNGTMAYVTTGHTVNNAEEAEGHANPGEIAMTQSTYDLVRERVEVGPAAKEPQEGFYQLLRVPPLEGAPQPLVVEEPPPGETMAQITYLVERLDRLTPYLSDELVARIVTNPEDARIPPEHRPVTVMFANYLGISDLIEDMGETRPDLITRHLNDYFVQMAQVVERYEGTIARMDQYAVGDRLVIFFGAPRAHEDDPVRAVYTALDMQQAVREHFSALQTPSGIYRFRQRIGINTGHLFAGNAGALNLRQEYTLMGDDINMAARLMSKAGWQEIFVSKKTQERVSAFFELRDRGELKVKGKQILIPTFQVVGRREEIGRTRGLTAGDGRLIDRVEELQALHGRGQGLLSSRGQIVAVIGDSGLGKSRLTRELKRWLLDSIGAQEGGPGDASEGVLWLEGQALSFSEQTSYWLMVQVLLGILDLPKGRPDPNDILFALWDRGEALLGKEAAGEAVPFLAALLDLPLVDDWADLVRNLDPKVRQKQTFWAAREFFSAAARQRPIVVALDDLHWADEASLAMLEDLLVVTDQAPLMFFLAFRPRRDKGCWRLRDKAAGSYPHRYTEVQLKPLSREHSQQLLDELLPVAGLASQEAQDGWIRAQQSILDKSAGNPFYLEEVVRSLIDGGAVLPDPQQSGRWQVLADQIEQVGVPDTLHGAIVARIDRLTEDARRALQVAAVIGRRFQVDILRNVAQAQAELDAWLAQLERSDLIRPAEAREVEALYAFPDALVQEVAYESLLVQHRQQFHLRIAEALEQVFADRLEQECALLAYHFSRSDDDERAIKYLDLAGRKAQAEFANETALGYYSDLLERLGDGEAIWQQRCDVLARRQQIYGILSSHDLRRADLEAVLALAEAHADDARRSDALNGLADTYQWTGRYAEAEETANAALELKTRLEEPAGQAAALHTLGVLSYYRGDYGTARPRLEQAVALRRVAGNSEGEAWSTMYLGMIHFMQGDYGQAATCHERALGIADGRQDWFQKGIHLTNIARVSLRMGEYEAALQQFWQSLEMKGRVGDRIGQGFAHFGAGLAYVSLDRHDEAATAMQASLDLREQIGDKRGIGYSLYGLGLVAMGRGQYEQAEDLFQRAYEARSALGLKAETIADLSYLGQARLQRGQPDAALQASTQAVELLAEQKNVEEVQQIYLNHYRVLAALDDPAAGDFLRQAQAAMLEQAARIADEERRQSFLEQVRVNQAIRAALQASG